MSKLAQACTPPPSSHRPLSWTRFDYLGMVSDAAGLFADVVVICLVYSTVHFGGIKQSMLSIPGPRGSYLEYTQSVPCRGRAHLDASIVRWQAALQLAEDPRRRKANRHFPRLVC